MNDLVFAIFWSLVLAGGLAVCILLFKLGLPRTYVRDLLHVGAGVWVIGWPAWEGAFTPILIAAVAFLGVVLLPRVSRARPLVEAVSGDDEAWSGVVGYTASFLLFTTLGLLGAPLPAAIALLALALGDGLGGLAGRRFGRLEMRLPYAKKKTLEGSMVVFAGAFAAVLLASLLFGGSLGFGATAAIAAAAAIAEAIAPRATDNVFVPLAAWSVATLVS